MIRVVYRWRINPSDFSDFRKTWKNTTNKIHASVPGAQGSFLLKACENEDEVLTIAKWDSFEAWSDFWGDGGRPQEMEAMKKLGERVSVEAYEEIDDLTR